MDASQISRDMAIVTPSDTEACNGVGFIFLGGACSIVTEKGSTVDLPVGLAGVVFPQSIQKVRATGTSATTVVVFRG